MTSKKVYSDDSSLGPLKSTEVYRNMAQLTASTSTQGATSLSYTLCFSPKHLSCGCQGARGNNPRDTIKTVGFEGEEKKHQQQVATW